MANNILRMENLGKSVRTYNRRTPVNLIFP